MDMSMVKGGEECLHIGLSRTRQGLLVTVRSNKQIENFMKSLGDGLHQDVYAYANKWSIARETDPPLRIWNMSSRNNPFTSLSSGLMQYRLDLPGRGLTLSGEVPGGEAIANISFLRLVGISEGAGVSFLMTNAVMSLNGLRDLKTIMSNSCKSLYMEYIRPVDLSLTIGNYNAPSNPPNQPPF